MTHEDARERLLDLAYGELSRRDARRVEAHAASCESCRGELSRIRETRRLMSALPAEPAPEAGERILIAAAREAARGRTPRRRLPAWLWGGAVAAVSVAAVVAVSYRIMEMRPGPLERDARDALLGDSPYARAPAPPAEPESLPPRPPPRPAGSPSPEPAPRKAERRPPTVRPEVAAPPRRAPAEEAEAPPRRAPAEEAEAPSRRASPEAAAPSSPPAPSPSADAPQAQAQERHLRAEAEAAPAAAPPGDAPRASAKAPGRAPATREPAPAMAAAEPASDALVRYSRLRDAGRLRGEIRTFPGCDGEAWRKVETDATGRVVKYVREGRIGGRRLRIEHVYGEDGALSSATVRDLDEPGAAVDADALGLALPSRAAEAAIDAPPRCGR